MEAKLRTDPPPFSARAGKTDRRQRKAPFALTFMIRSKSSSLVLVAVPAWAIPALFTRIAGKEKVSVVAARAASMLGGSVTPQATGKADPPSLVISFAVASADSMSCSQMAIRAPFLSEPPGDGLANSLATPRDDRSFFT